MGCNCRMGSPPFCCRRLLMSPVVGGPSASTTQGHTQHVRRLTSPLLACREEAFFCIASSRAISLQEVPLVGIIVQAHEWKACTVGHQDLTGYCRCFPIKTPGRDHVFIQGCAPSIWSVCLPSVSELPELLEWGFSTLAGLAAPPGLHQERILVSPMDHSIVCCQRILLMAPQDIDHCCKVVLAASDGDSSKGAICMERQH